MLVFSESSHPRLIYAWKNLCRDAENLPEFTKSQDEFLAYSGPKCWYGEAAPQGNFPVIQPVDLLWNDRLQKLKPEINYRNNIPFPDLDGSGRFDPVACTFFMLSRYEEYLYETIDAHGRFSGHQTWCGAEIVKQPLVDLWAMAFGSEMHAYFPAYKFRLPEFRNVATIDVDSAFAFRYKGIRRTSGALLLDVVSGKWFQAWRRMVCVITNAQDPFDTYHFIQTTCKERPVELRVFFLLADRSRFDINVDYRNEELQDRICELHNDGALVGIHPGYRSHQSIQILRTEIKRLEHILGEPVVHSRQHYLKVHLPETYRRLLASGIINDHSMGFADVPGFRAGTCRPFFWFDAEKNQETQLRIHPVVVMDSTLNSYMHLKPTQAIELIDQLKREVRTVHGEFTSLWHNETVAERGIWKGWREVWKSCLR